MHDAALIEYRARIESLESAIKSRDAEVQRLHESSTALAEASNARKEQLEDERGKFEVLNLRIKSLEGQVADVRHEKDDAQRDFDRTLKEYETAMDELEREAASKHAEIEARFSKDMKEARAEDDSRIKALESNLADALKTASSQAVDHAKEVEAWRQLESDCRENYQQETAALKQELEFLTQRNRDLEQSLQVSCAEVGKAMGAASVAIEEFKKAKEDLFKESKNKDDAIEGLKKLLAAKEKELADQKTKDVARKSDLQEKELRREKEREEREYAWGRERERLENEKEELRREKEEVKKIEEARREKDAEEREREKDRAAATHKLGQEALRYGLHFSPSYQIDCRKARNSASSKEQC